MNDVLEVGTTVVKQSGYPYPGIIVGVCRTTAGLVRYVVEATGADYRGMLHIFSREQLLVVEDPT